MTFIGRKSRSIAATNAARGSSKKAGTRPERVLRQALWAAGQRYRTNVAALPGRPDIVFLGARVAVFVDGDFWHGRDWPARRAKLENGHNADYWIPKIERNIRRDAERTLELERRGWTVVRLWETEVLRQTAACVRRVELALAPRREPASRGIDSLMPAIPPISRFEQPVLLALAKLGGEALSSEIDAEVAKIMGLTPEQLAVTHGQENRSEAAYRSAWARTRLRKRELLTCTGVGRWRLTDAGASFARI